MPPARCGEGRLQKETETCLVRGRLLQWRGDRCAARPGVGSEGLRCVSGNLGLVSDSRSCDLRLFGPLNVPGLSADEGGPRETPGAGGGVLGRAGQGFLQADLAPGRGHYGDTDVHS